MKTIILAIDYLGACRLGPYGNTWIDTPNLNRLASEATVFDRCFITGPSREDFLRAVFRAEHPWQQNADHPMLIQILAERGIPSIFISDDTDLLCAARSYGSCSTLELPKSQPSQPVENPQDALIARQVEAVGEHLRRVPSPAVIWIFLTTLGRVWDAPIELRRKWLRAGDPEPSEQTVPPGQITVASESPEEVLPWLYAYAAQVAAFDQALGQLNEYLSHANKEAETALIVVGMRGINLGEHCQFGTAALQLYTPFVHVPLIAKLPQAEKAARCLELVQVIDLCPLVAQLYGLQYPTAPDAANLLLLAQEGRTGGRDRICIASTDESAICTPAWFMRNIEPPELFVKPDDYWDANDVSDRCPEIVELLQQHIQQYQCWLASGCQQKLPALAPQLCQPPE